MSSAARGTVELLGVSKRFGDVAAVDGVSLTVASGELLALLGPSGCGKSTTLRMIGGFEVADAGRVLIGGVDVSSHPPHRRPVNTVFQHYALFPHMSVAQNVGYGLARRGVPREERQKRVADMLAQVAMAPYADRLPHALSGGQQQRVALARALVNQPDVLLLDEPLGALDRQLRQQMQVELKQVQKRLGMTFVYVTHDQEEAMAMADRVAVMHEGRLEQVATPTVVYDQPSSAFVAGFVGVQNFLIGQRHDARTVRIGSVSVVSTRAADLAHVESADVVMTAAIRPEAISWREDGPETTSNAVRGKVRAAQPLGDTLQYVVDIEGHDLIVRQRRAGASPLVVGDVRWWVWSAEVVQLFAGRESARRACQSQGRSYVEPGTYASDVESGAHA